MSRVRKNLLGVFSLFIMPFLFNFSGLRRFPLKPWSALAGYTTKAPSDGKWGEHECEFKQRQRLLFKAFCGASAQRFLYNTVQGKENSAFRFVSHPGITAIAFIASEQGAHFPLCCLHVACVL